MIGKVKVSSTEGTFDPTLEKGSRPKPFVLRENFPIAERQAVITLGTIEGDVLQEETLYKLWNACTDALIRSGYWERDGAEAMQSGEVEPSQVLDLAPFAVKVTLE